MKKIHIKIMVGAGRYETIDFLPVFRIYLDCGFLMCEVAWFGFYAYGGIRLWDAFKNKKTAI